MQDFLDTATDEGQSLLELGGVMTLQATARAKQACGHARRALAARVGRSAQLSRDGLLWHCNASAAGMSLKEDIAKHKASLPLRYTREWLQERFREFYERAEPELPPRFTTREWGMLGNYSTGPLTLHNSL